MFKNSSAVSVLVAVLILWAVQFVKASSNCVVRQCALQKYFKHYEDLNCRPIWKRGKDCPIRYDCSILGNLFPDKCYYNGEERETVSQSEIGDCYAQCDCYKNNDESSSFACAVFDCAAPPDDESCIRTYNMDFNCCASYVCGEDVNNLGTCYYNDQTYKEGEVMDIDPCYKCLCDRNFNNQTSVRRNGNCKKRTCYNIYLDYIDSLRLGCSPVYRDNVCCPTEWKCPESTDVIESVTPTSNDPKMKCKYGDQMLNVGDVVKNTDNPALNCQCSVPPLLTCNI